MVNRSNQSQIYQPESVYHGTLDIYLDSFKHKLLDSQYWRPGRDFGEGFYTTTSLQQAKDWAVKMQDKYDEGLPCVLKVGILKPDSLNPTYLIFPPGPSETWAGFIFEHRKTTRKGQDPCKRHPEIVMGPMADADTGKIIQDAVQWNKDVHWFYDRIIRNNRNRLLDAFRLGYQITFCSERLERMLSLHGYYVQKERGWVYHENRDQASRA